MSDEGAPSSKERDPLSIACELVGRFQYYFSRMERELDDGIAKVLQLNEGAAHIVCANLDFVKKINIIKSAVTLSFIDRDGSMIDLLNKINGINQPHRQNLIHATFEPAAKNNGVNFLRTTARDKLKRDLIEWERTKFEDYFSDMERYAADLENLIRDLKPYVPSLDFSDARNSTYLILGF